MKPQKSNHQKNGGGGRKQKLKPPQKLPKKKGPQISAHPVHLFGDFRWQFIWGAEMDNASCMKRGTSEAAVPKAQGCCYYPKPKHQVYLSLSIEKLTSSWSLSGQTSSTRGGGVNDKACFFICKTWLQDEEGAIDRGGHHRQGCACHQQGGVQNK